MSAPLCAVCAATAEVALLRPSAAPCDAVEFACRRCVGERRGHPILLAGVADALPALGAHPRTRRAALLLSLALVDASNGGRARHARKQADAAAVTEAVQARTAAKRRREAARAA